MQEPEKSPGSVHGLSVSMKDSSRHVEYGHRIRYGN